MAQAKDKITAAVKFLQNAKVRESSLPQRKLFLQKKAQVSTASKFRDFVGFTVIIGGVGYAIYYLLRRCVGEALFGVSEDQKQMAAMTKSVLQLEESVGEMLRGMREMQGQMQQQQLNLTQIITNMGSPEVARIQDSRDMSELKESINSLKGLLLSRRQFPPTPVTAPVLPAWQLSKGDIASEASSSAISVTTNVSTTSNSSAQETDSAEDVNLCEDKVVQNIKKESDLQEENSSDEKQSSPTNGMKEVASDEMFES
ncbi:hypothetical protein NP493_389g03141 [Ridgeia piscesae]|uniref:Peroxin-14 n=1 Tax=Ridgeia piscesae TaxID=27915 RepID=A0AAD9NSX8_RIDPI|nr:hypothetical protein NP493_389g03141 [Ridgeia piscesae]